MKVLVTGAGGFLGSRIVKALSSSDYTVTGATTKVGLGKNLQGEFELRRIDWDDTISLNEICVGQDAVIHTAGMNFVECAADPNRANNFNGKKTTELIEAASKNGVQSFIYLSTVHVYADPLVGNFFENSATTAKHAYATSHLLGEKGVLDKIEDNQISGKILRVGNTFGAPILHGRGSPWNNLINECCKSLVETNKIEIKNNPNVERDYIPIGYLLMELELILQKKMNSRAHIINLVSRNSRSIHEVVQIILRIFRDYSDFNVKPNVSFNQPNAIIEHLCIKNSDSTILSPFLNTYLFDEINSIFRYLTGKNNNVK
jgi:UDP-glucose 4-epimerase